MTLTDPGTYSRPWTVVLPMTKTDGPVFEYACHEREPRGWKGFCQAITPRKRSGRTHYDPQRRLQASGTTNVTVLIGEGGMEQVYRATDTKLNRGVALKVLPEAFASDPDRLARFQREAQVLASLNHPNIAAIHGIEEADGRASVWCSNSYEQTGDPHPDFSAGVLKRS